MGVSDQHVLSMRVHIRQPTIDIELGGDRKALDVNDAQRSTPTIGDDGCLLIERPHGDRPPMVRRRWRDFLQFRASHGRNQKPASDDQADTLSHGIHT